MHPALQDIRDIIAEGEMTEAVDALLPFLSSQMGEGAAPRIKRRFIGYRDEVLVHSASVARLRKRRRQALDDPAALDREERRLTMVVADLVSEIDGQLQRAGSAAPAEMPAMDAGLAAAIPEKVYGRGNLQPLAWLAQGAQVGQAVCRVVTPKSIGTGFLIPGGKVITNNHVVQDAALAGQATVEFGFERDADGQLKTSVIFPVSAEGFVTAPPPLDCSILTVDASADALREWGHVDLAPDDDPTVGDPVAIIQHPNGGEKQVAVTANEVVAVEAGRLAYLTDTLAGSSGAPVFDARWRVVALHRAGGAEVMGAEGRIRANEGVLFSRLLQDPAIAAAINGA